MKVFRIGFKWSETTNQEVDIISEHIGLAIGEALSFLQSRNYTYRIEHCYKAELISEPITKKEKR